MTKINTGLQLNLSTMQGVHKFKKPDIHCDIDGIVHTLKFGKHTLELPAGNHVLTIKTGPAPIFGDIIEDQSISFNVQENALTFINYKVNVLYKSSIKFGGIIEHKEEQSKPKKEYFSIGRTLGKIVVAGKKLKNRIKK